MEYNDDIIDTVHGCCAVPYLGGFLSLSSYLLGAVVLAEKKTYRVTILEMEFYGWNSPGISVTTRQPGAVYPRIHMILITVPKGLPLCEKQSEGAWPEAMCME